MRRAALGMCTGVVLASASPTAQARPRCAPQPWFSGPGIAAGSGLEMGEVATQTTCSGPRARMACRIDATYRVHNAGTNAVAVPAIVHASEGVRQTVTVDGRAPQGARAPTLDEDELEYLRRDDDHWVARAFLLEVPAGATVRIDVRSEGFRRAASCGDISVLEHRHRVVGRDMTAEIRIEDRGNTGFARPDGAAYVGRVHVPAHWRIRHRRWMIRDRDAGPGWWIARSPWFGPQIQRNPPIRWGGPFVAIGVTGDARRSEPKLRGGWELGLGRRFVTAVAVESDTKRHVDVVPTIELVPRAWPRDEWLWFPAPALGLGVPVRAWPDVRTGVRAQVGLHWRFVGVVAMFDAYPRTSDRPPRLLGGGALQVSF